MFLWSPEILDLFVEAVCSFSRVLYFSALVFSFPVICDRGAKEAFLGRVRQNIGEGGGKQSLSHLLT